MFTAGVDISACSRPVKKAFKMSLSRFGLAPKSLSRALPRAGALAIALLGAGCSSKHTQYSSGPLWGMDAPPAQVAQHTARRQPVVEDDGMEAQPEPLRRQMIEPDDPAEPFSPNYGNRPGDPPARRPAEPQRRGPSPNSGEGKVRTAEQPAVPENLPPYFRRRLVSADSGE